MKIRVLESNSALPMARPGTEREVNEVLGRHLIGLKYAEAVEGDGIETAMRAAPETAAARPRRKRGVQPSVVSRQSSVL